jgi:hypothetical protein
MVAALRLRTVAVNRLPSFEWAPPSGGSNCARNPSLQCIGCIVFGGPNRRHVAGAPPERWPSALELPGPSLPGALEGGWAVSSPSRLGVLPTGALGAGPVAADDLLLTASFPRARSGQDEHVASPSLSNGPIRSPGSGPQPPNAFRSLPPRLEAPTTEPNCACRPSPNAFRSLPPD